METAVKSKRIEEARAEVDKICAENGWDLRDMSNWQSILREIDKRHDKRTYKCRYCWDTGVIVRMDPEDGMLYGRRCGLCRHWDDLREKAREERERRGNA